jgi:hypothetical protein
MTAATHHPMGPSRTTAWARTLVFVPLHLEIDVVIEGPIWPSRIPNNHVIDLILYADAPPQSG